MSASDPGEHASPPLTARQMRKLSEADNARSAIAADLIYVSSGQAGIRRVRKGRGFGYLRGKKAVKDAATLDRIRHLAIPPAWNDVWICTQANGHLQATGRDAKGRKQYRYHKRWGQVRGATKFFHLAEFGRRLPAIRKRMEEDLGAGAMPKKKVLAAAVRVMETTNIRVGNAAYAKDNASFGLSTLKDRHLQRGNTGLRLRFKGKSGVMHDLPVHGRRLARIVARCKELPGQDLFQWEDEQGKTHAIDSGQVNAYIEEISGGGFTSKDLRTWMGSVHCIAALLECDDAVNKTDRTQNINHALDNVAKHLGNTRSVCRKYYVHPAVLECYAEGRLTMLAHGVRRRPRDLHRAESMLVKLLKKTRAS